MYLLYKIVITKIQNYQAITMSMTLVELKAKIKDIETVRKELLSLGVQYVGKFHQKDTYYNTSKGRLKIRETEGKETVDIVFYERQNVPDIKESKILLVQTEPPKIAKKLLSKLFAVKIVVDKIREIYKLNETQVHLDIVSKLGTFIEFEHPTNNKRSQIEKSKIMLEEYCNKLGIKREQLEALSYSDLLYEKHKLRNLKVKKKGN